mgnify:CR=1 FL=1
MDKNEILNSDCDVRCFVAGNPNTPVDVLTELAKDRDWYIRSYAAGNPNMLVDVLTELAKDRDYIVRCLVAGNPNTPVDVLTELAKDSYWCVRRYAAGNPNTPVDVLTELAKDNNCDVRRNAARNPNMPGYEAEELQFMVKDTYVSVQGTTHIWYKHNYPNVAPFYTCGCFYGSREQLLMRIYTTDNQGRAAERMRILNALDEKFKEVFNR